MPFKTPSSIPMPPSSPSTVLPLYTNKDVKRGRPDSQQPFSKQQFQVSPKPLLSRASPAAIRVAPQTPRAYPTIGNYGKEQQQRDPRQRTPEVQKQLQPRPLHRAAGKPVDPPQDHRLIPHEEYVVSLLLTRRSEFIMLPSTLWTSACSLDVVARIARRIASATCVKGIQLDLSRCSEHGGTATKHSPAAIPAPTGTPFGDSSSVTPEAKMARFVDVLVQTFKAHTFGRHTCDASAASRWRPTPALPRHHHPSSNTKGSSAAVQAHGHDPVARSIQHRQEPNHSSPTSEAAAGFHLRRITVVGGITASLLEALVPLFTSLDSITNVSLFPAKFTPRSVDVLIAALDDSRVDTCCFKPPATCGVPAGAFTKIRAILQRNKVKPFLAVPSTVAGARPNVPASTPKPPSSAKPRSEMAPVVRQPTPRTAAPVPVPYIPPTPPPRGGAHHNPSDNEQGKNVKQWKADILAKLDYAQRGLRKGRPWQELGATPLTADNHRSDGAGGEADAQPPRPASPRSHRPTALATADRVSVPVAARNELLTGVHSPRRTRTPPSPSPPPAQLTSRCSSPARHVRQPLATAPNTRLNLLSPSPPSIARSDGKKSSAKAMSDVTPSSATNHMVTPSTTEGTTLLRHSKGMPSVGSPPLDFTPAAAHRILRDGCNVQLPRYDGASPVSAIDAATSVDSSPLTNTTPGTSSSATRSGVYCVAVGGSSPDNEPLPTGSRSRSHTSSTSSDSRSPSGEHRTPTEALHGSTSNSRSANQCSQQRRSVGFTNSVVVRQKAEAEKTTNVTGGSLPLTSHVPAGPASPARTADASSRRLYSPSNAQYTPVGLLSRVELRTPNPVAACNQAARVSNSRVTETFVSERRPKDANIDAGEAVEAARDIHAPPSGKPLLRTSPTHSPAVSMFEWREKLLQSLDEHEKRCGASMGTLVEDTRNYMAEVRRHLVALHQQQQDQSMHAGCTSNNGTGRTAGTQPATEPLQTAVL